MASNKLNYKMDLPNKFRFPNSTYNLYQSITKLTIKGCRCTSLQGSFFRYVFQ